MAFTKSYKKKYYGKKRTNTKRAYTNKKQTKAIASLQNQIDKFKPELKYVATGPINVTISNSAPSVSLLNGLTKGTDQTNNRIGDQVRMSFVNLRINLRMDPLTIIPSTTPAAYSCRILIVKEKTTLGSTISLTQFFNTATPYTYSQRNVSTRDPKRFKTYYDKVFMVGNYGGNKEEINIKINKRLGFKTDYSRNNTGTVSDIDTNGLFLIVLTNYTGATGINFSADQLTGFYDA